MELGAQVGEVIVPRRVDQVHGSLMPRDPNIVRATDLHHGLAVAGQS